MYHPQWLHYQPDESPAPPFALRWVALAFICVAIFISAIDTTIANIALSSIGLDLGAGTSGLQWVMDAFNIVLASFVLLGGGLADRWGRKGVFMVGFVLFGLASLTAAFSTSIGSLVASRAAMGLGAALIYPAALSLLAAIFPPHERLKAIAIWSSVGGAGLAFGPTLGGVLLDNFWWGSVFLVNVPVVIVGVVGAALVIPTSRRPDAVSLDKGGALLSVLGLGGLVYGVIEAPSHGLTDPVVLGALLVGVSFTTLFVLWELHIDEPMFNPRLLRIRRVIGGSTVLFFGYVVLTGVLFVVPLYLQFVLDDSTLKMGLSLLPLGLTFTVVSLFAAKIAGRVGARISISSSLVAVGVACLVITTARYVGGYASVALGTALLGGGLAVGATPATHAVMDAVPEDRAGDASAINQITRQVGACLGVAVLGSLFAGAYAAEVTSATSSLTSSQAAMAENGISGAVEVASDVGGSSGSALLTSADSALDVGLQVSLTVAAVLALLGALISWRALASPDAVAVDDG